jgi:hypothetical protein
VFVQSAIDLYAPDYGKPTSAQVGGVFVMGMGLLVLGIPVAALSNIGGRDFFRGKTLNAGTEITVLDASAY